MYLALLSAAWYWIWGTCPFYTLWQTLNKPLCIALFLGIASGRVAEAMLIGAVIQGIYLGVIMPGGTYTADPALAACIAIPVALNTGMDAMTAVTLAVPVGILGTTLSQFRYIFNGYFAVRADKYIEKLDTKEIMRCAALYPWFVSLLVKGLPVFIAVYLGSGVIETFLEFVPEWVTNGFVVAGGCLPAVGFAIALNSINQNSIKLLPFFVIGFFVSKLLGITTIAAAIIAACIALVIVFFQNDNEEPIESV